VDYKEKYEKLKQIVESQVDYYVSGGAWTESEALYAEIVCRKFISLVIKNMEAKNESIF